MGKKKVKKSENKIQESEEDPNLKGDYGNIFILLSLYILQGNYNPIDIIQQYNI